MFSRRLLIMCLAICGCNSLLANTLEQSGLYYKKIVTQDKQLIHTLIINPNQLLIKIISAKNFGSTIETVHKLAKQEKAIAAVNGGFFQVHNNTYTSPAGILKIQNTWYGISYANRGAIAWNKLSKAVVLDRIQTISRIIINNAKYPIQLLNKPSNTHSALLYSTSIPRTITVLGKRINYIIQQEKIIAITQENSVTIPNNGYVYSVINNPKQPKAVIGDPAYVDIKLSPQFSNTVKDLEVWNNAEYIIGGAPLLIKDQQKINSYRTEKISNAFINNRHARTAVGILSNQNWLFVVVEQNPLFGIEGMNLSELADFMLEQGCTDALNLDGGTSTTFYLRDYIENTIAWPVANAIVITKLVPS